MAAPIIAPSSSSGGTGITLQTYYRDLADELGFYAATTATATVASGETGRVVIAGEWRDDEDGETAFARHYLHVVDGAQAGVQRRVLSGGYEGPLSALRLSRPLSAPLASGTTVELTHPLPVRRHLNAKGLVEIVDEALARIFVEARLSLTGNGTREYDLTDYPWLTAEGQILGLYDSTGLSSSEPLAFSPYRHRLVADGAAVTLVTSPTYSSSDTFEVAVRVRADRLIHDGASWAYSATPGLQGHADWQAAAPLHWVRAAGMVKALQQWRKLVVSQRGMDPDERRITLGDIEDRLQHWSTAEGVIHREEARRVTVEQTAPVAAVTRGRGRRWP